MLLSDARPGLTPLPETIEASVKTAFVNATVIPMTEGLPVLENHTVLVENGLITAVGPVSDVPIADDVTRIDATGLFLAPGMSEMHLHLTFGGQAATIDTISDGQLTVTAPAGAAGAVDVVVTTPGGSVTSTGGFTYIPPPTISNISPDEAETCSTPL